MRNAAFLAILVFAVGCGSSETAPESKNPANDGREAERADLRSRIDAKKQEFSKVDGDLAKVTSERESLKDAAPSETKTNRLIELSRLENDLRARKASLSDEINQLEAKLSGAPAPEAKKPVKAGDALDDILAGNENKEKEEAERRKKKAEDDASADKERIAKAEAARKAELEEREKQKIEGGRLAADKDGPGFEERWGDVITKIRAELQKYKRW